MARWGGEETKGQGILGCAVAGLVLLFAIFVCYKGYPAVSTRHDLEQKINKVVASAWNKKPVEIENELIKTAKDLGYDLPREDIELTVNAENASAPVVKVKVKFSYKIDLAVWSGVVRLPSIYSEATLVRF